MNKFSVPADIIKKIKAATAVTPVSSHERLIRLGYAIDEAVGAAEELGIANLREEAERCKNLFEKFVTRHFLRLFQGDAGTAPNLGAAVEIGLPIVALHVANELEIWADSLATAGESV